MSRARTIARNTSIERSSHDPFHSPAKLQGWQRLQVPGLQGVQVDIERQLTPSKTERMSRRSSLPLLGDNLVKPASPSSITRQPIASREGSKRLPPPGSPAVGEASRDLQVAMLEENTEKLFRAVSVAKSVGVDKETLAKAVKQLQKQEATDALSRIVEKCLKENVLDAPLLTQAIKRAKASEVDEEHISKAQRCVDRFDAEQMLRYAMSSKETGCLRSTIDRAVTLGADQELLVEAETLLKNVKANRLIIAGFRSNSLGKLEQSVAAAKNLGYEGDDFLLAQEMVTLHKAEKDKVAPAPAPVDPFAKEKSESQMALLRAIQFRETGSLKLAIRRARIEGAHDDLVKEAETLLAQLEVDLLIGPALKKQDQKKLKELLQRSVKFNLQSEAIDQARSVFAMLDGQEVLTRAVSERKAPQLKEAIERAYELSLDRGKITKAEAVLTKLLSKTRLAEAMKARDPEELRQAIAAAEAAGGEKRDIASAVTLLNQLSKLER